MLVILRQVRPVAKTVFWQELAEYSSGSLAFQGGPYTPSTHTSLESPCNGGINGYFTFEHGLLQGEPSIITSKWGFWHRKGTFITPDTHIF
eukprot:COSAG01_NODE_6275_length_3759_cov_249.376606_2_plen_91_part_00